MNDNLLDVLRDAEADLAALERFLNRNLPGFQSPTLAKVRAMIQTIEGEKQ